MQNTIKKEIQKQQPHFIVGIGASAGGLESFIELINSLNPNSGLAYILVQHLDPDHKSILADLLSKRTSISLKEVENNMTVMPNHIYVIPSNKNIALEKGVLLLSERSSTHSPHMTIDHFFHSLAKDQKDRAIGVILSGTGTDGTSGMQAIKAEGGITFAQDKSAKFAGMPESVINSSTVDLVLNPSQIAAELEKISRNFLHPYLAYSDDSSNENETKAILLSLRLKTGVDFSNYKDTTIKRRIYRRMLLHNIETLDQYRIFLEGNEHEPSKLLDDILINVTSFFRNAEVFEALKTHVFPQVVKDKSYEKPIRIWVAGCSTGQEAYSIAIVLYEFLQDNKLTIPVQIFATDLDQKAIEKARAGIFLNREFSNMSTNRLNKFFTKTRGSYQINKFIREMCVFTQHNVCKDPPFSKLDLISCRNLLIYLGPPLQKRVLSTFHYALLPKRYLLLGKAETIGEFTKLYQPIDKKYSLYVTKPSTTNTAFGISMQKDAFKKHSYAAAPSVENNRRNKETDAQKEADRLLLSRYAPTGVLINEDMEVEQFRGDTSLYLSPASGKASFNILKMARDGLSIELRTIIKNVKASGVSVRKTGLQIKVGENMQKISVEVIPLTMSGDIHYLILFEKESVLGQIDKTLHLEPRVESGEFSEDQKNQRINQLELELVAKKEDMKDVIEDLESVNQELQSANEEILSSNEELQSTNEELETSKEELQSGNEELNTVNQEVIVRNTELEASRDHLFALIQTIREPLLTLDKYLRVVSANDSFYKIFKVKPEETENMLIFELGNGQWNIPGLQKLLLEILPKNSSFNDFEVEHIFPKIGKKNMLLNARKIEKSEMILLAIDDITDKKQAEATMSFQSHILQNVRECVIVTDLNGIIIYWNKGATDLFGYTAEEMIGQTPEVIFPEDGSDLKAYLNEILGGKNYRGDWKGRKKDGEIVWLDTVTTPFLDDMGKSVGFIGVSKDITQKREKEVQKDDFISTASHELKTPLTSLVLYIQMLRNQLNSAEKKRHEKIILNLEKQSKLLTGLISDMLDIKKIQQGKIILNMTDFDLNLCVKEVVEMLALVSPKHSLEVEGEINHKVFGDREKISQTITNLLSNAIKYSPLADKVLVKLSQNEKKARISVEDFGIGLDQKDQERVFDRFYRVKEQKPGMGIGLYFASQIIQLHGGRIDVKSEIEKGSTFSFSLPLSKESSL